MRALVTGGGGFLGRAIAEQLLERDDEVTILARGRYDAVEALGAKGVQADIRGPVEPLIRAIDGADVVFHVAAKAGVWGRREEYLSINYDGTRNVLAAAKTAGVGRFVYTSTPSVVFGKDDIIGSTEADCTYPDSFEAPYPESKARAERLVLEANGQDMATTALRPQLIWGPGDPHLVPRLIQRRQRGRLARIGKGDNKVAITYVDNAAAAHVQAADALAPDSPNAGKAYFVTDGEPVLLWDWVDEMLEGVGLERVQRHISYPVARRVGGVLELVWRIFGLSGEPPMTRFVAAKLASSYWYDITAAREDFGYTLRVSPEEGFARMVEAFRVA